MRVAVVSLAIASGLASVCFAQEAGGVPPCAVGYLLDSHSARDEMFDI
jgi:hypothetical protein